MTTENEQITPADAAIVSSGTGTKGPEERDLPASLKEEMDLCLQILREVLGEFDENLLAKFDEVREHALKASDERFSGILTDTNPDQDDLQKVVDIVDKMDVHDAQLLARAFTTYFHLANLCEENYRVSVLHSREAAVDEDQAVDPVNEMTCAYHQLINEMGPARAKELLDQLEFHPVFTAHPTEARRQAVDVDPLYINFTSGSTGVPKGVTVSHRSVLDFIPQFAEIFGITQNDILGNQAPFDFDVSVKDLYTALYTGAKVQIIPRAYFSQPTKLMDYLADHEVTILVWAVSAMCFVSIMNGFSYRIPSRVRQVLFSGEVMPIKHLMKWKSALPHARFVNLYGPTEITCNCTYAILPDRDFAPDEALPIGCAFPNEKVFLLDENDALVTVPGQAGEICVSGTALALGYYADPVRTAQAFTQNPLNTNWYERIYRTGDLARYDESGSLYYIGRRDFQIKHMGHRVELGEIEATAMRCDAVTRACCTFDAERQRLHLFYTGSCEKAALLAALKESLPPFMQPNTAVQLDEMPLNKNGKIDRTALAALTKKGAHK